MSFLPKWEAIDFCLYPYITQSSDCPCPNPLKRSCILDTQNQYISYIILSVWLEHLEFWTDLLLFFKEMEMWMHTEAPTKWSPNLPSALKLQFSMWPHHKGPAIYFPFLNKQKLKQQWTVHGGENLRYRFMPSFSQQKANLHKHMGNLSNTIWKAHAFICKMLIY